MQKKQSLTKRAVSLFLTGAMLATSVMPAYAAEAEMIQDPMEGLTVFENGKDFNRDINSLTGNVLPFLSNSDVEAIIWADELPEDESVKVIKVSDNKHGDIFAWYETSEEIQEKANLQDESEDLIAPGYVSDYDYDYDYDTSDWSDYEYSFDDSENEIEEYKNTVYLYSPEMVYLPKDSSKMLSNLENLTDVSFLEKTDFSYTENLASFFEGDKALTDITALMDADTSSVINMDKMFKDCSLLEDVYSLDEHDVYSEPDMNGDTYYMYTAWIVKEDVSCEEFLDGTLVSETDRPQWYINHLAEQLAKEQESSEEVPTDESESEEALSDESVTEEIPLDESVTEEVPSDESVTEEVPADTSTVEEILSDESETEKAPADESVTEEVLKDESVAEEAKKEESVKDEKPVEKDKDVDKSKNITEQEQEKTTEPENITKEDDENKVLDAVIEKYIKDNVDTSKTGEGELQFANIMRIQQTLFSDDVLQDDDTLNSVMVDRINETIHGWLGSYISIVPVYKLGDGDYYVAYANTMMQDPNAFVLDYDFAHINTNGELVENVIYDTTNGLAYIPKAEYITEEDADKEALGWIQGQFLQRIYGNEETVESSVQVSMDEGKNISTNIQNDNPTGVTTTVQTEADMNEDKLEVSVNGLPIEGDNYTYDSSTGELSVNMPSASIISISVKEQEETLTEKITGALSDALGIKDANAYNVNTIALPDVPPIEIPANIQVGDYWTGYSLYRVASVGGAAALPQMKDQSYLYGIDPYVGASNEDMAFIKDAVLNNNPQSLGDHLYVKSRGMLNQQIDFTKSGTASQGVSYGNSTYKFYHNGQVVNSESGKLPFEVLNRMSVFCAHIANPLRFYDVSIPEAFESWEAGRIVKETYIRVLGIGEINGQKTITIGVVGASNTAPAENGQSGIIIIRVPVKETEREFKLKKIDKVTNAVIPGNKGGTFKLYQLDTTKSGTVTIENHSVRGQWVPVSDLKDNDNDGIYTFKTTANNEINPDRWYRIVETKKPKGYQFNSEEKERIFQFPKDATSCEKAMKNVPNKVILRLTKTDKNNPSRKLIGGEFKIYEWDKAHGKYKDTPIATMTDAGNGVYTYGIKEGQVITSGLTITENNLGKFRVIETGNPYYEVGGQRIPYIGNYKEDFKLKSDEIEVGLKTLQATNNKKLKKGKIRLTKRDSDTGNDLGDGFVFNVYSASYKSDGTRVFGSQPCDTLTYNSRTRMYESISLPRVDEEIDKDSENHIYYNKGEYKLTEASTAPGYSIAQETLIGTFEIPADGDYDTVSIIDTLKTINPAFSSMITVNNRIIVSNRPNEFDIIKTNHTNNVLDGVKFKIWTREEDKQAEYAGNTITIKSSEDTADTFVTDANGKIVLKKIYPGTYYYKEIETKDGYDLDETIRTFTVSAKNGKVSLTNDNGQSVSAVKASNTIVNMPKQPLHITKADTDYDEGTGVYQSSPNAKDPEGFPDGTEFAIYEWNKNLTEDSSGNKYEKVPYIKIKWDSTNNKFVDIATGKEPELVYSETNEGKFSMKETKQRGGYILDKTIKYINIFDETQISDGAYQVSFENIPNGIKIKKLNIKGETLPEGYVAEFLFKLSGSTLSKTITTTYNSEENENSAHLYRLPPGTWTYKETVVKKFNPSTNEYEQTQDYKIDQNEYSFTVKKDGTIDETSFTNSALEISNTRQSILKIKKLDAETLMEEESESGFPSGTSFGVYEWSEETQSYRNTPSMTIIPKEDAQNLTNINAGTQNAGSDEKEIKQVTIQKADERDINHIVILDNLEEAHGQLINDIIKSINPNAECTYIPVTDVNQDGAIDAKEVLDNLNKVEETNAGILLFTWTANKTEENNKVSEKLDEIASKGIKVITAAGNNGDNAENYVPATSKNAVVIGAVDADGKETLNTNNGKRVNYYVEADSTSKAAAKYAGAYSNGTLTKLNVFRQSKITDGVKDLQNNPTDTFVQNALISLEESGIVLKDYAIRADTIYLKIEDPNGQLTTKHHYLIARYESSTYNNVQWNSYNIANNDEPRVEYTTSNFVVFSRVTTQPTDIIDRDTGNARTFNYSAKITSAMVGGQNRAVAVELRETTDTTGAWTSNVTTDALFGFKYLQNQKVQFKYGTTTGSALYAGPGMVFNIPNNAAKKNGYKLEWINSQNQVTGYAGRVRSHIIPAFQIKKTGNVFYQHGLNNSENYNLTLSTSSTGVPTYVLTAKYTAHKYKIVYNSGDHGTGSMASDTKTYGTDFTLKANTFTPAAGWHFAGWKVSDDAGVDSAHNPAYYGKTIADKARITGGLTYGLDNTVVTVTLTAQWERNKYAIRFDKGAEDATGTMSGQILQAITEDDESVTYTINSNNTARNIAVGTYVYMPTINSSQPANEQVKFQYRGHTFKNWLAPEPDGYFNPPTGGVINAGMRWTVMGTPDNNYVFVLTANWETDSYDIEYILGDGGTLSNQVTSYTYSKNPQTIALGTPQRLGYTFNGWRVKYTDPSEERILNAEDAKIIPGDVVGKITYEAIWTSNDNKWVNKDTAQAPVLVETKDNKGKFMIKELTATPGYIMDESVKYVDLNNDIPEEPDTYVREFTNIPNMYRIAKVRRNENGSTVRLPNIDFRFWVNDDIANAKTYTTDSSGLITLRRLQDGEWHYQEIIDGNPVGVIHSFTVVKGVTPPVVKQDQLINEYIINTTYFITIHKVDNHGFKLPNIKFNVKSPSGTITQYTTSSAGLAYIKLEEVGNYEITEDPNQTLPEGYTLSTETKVLTVSRSNGQYVVTNSDGTNNAEFSVIFENPSNEVKIHKTDENGNTLPNATFRIWFENDEANAMEKVTDLSGEILLRGLKDGTWHYKEIKAPEGYYMNESDRVAHDFVITNGFINGTDISTTFTCVNHPNSVQLIKTDEEGVPLANVKFKLYYKDNPDIFSRELTTGADGKTPVVEGLRPGEYAYYEITSSTPDGYINEHKVYTITVKEDNETQVGTAHITETIVNKKNTFRMLKVDTNDTPLKDVVFEFTYTGNSNRFESETGYVKEGNTATFTKQTDASGIIAIDKLPQGSYTVKEKENNNLTANGTHYVISDTIYEFTVDEFGKFSSENSDILISEDSAQINLTVYNSSNPKGSLSIKKQDEDENDLQGAEFEIYELIDDTERLLENNQYTYTYDSDSNTYKYLNLEITPENKGHFRIKEVKSPSGYILKNVVRDFTLTPENTYNITIIIENTKNRMRLRKVNEEDEGLGGAVFRIWKSGEAGYDGEIIDAEYTTDDNGYTEYKEVLSPGTWNYQEIQAPPIDKEASILKYYQLDSTIHHFQVDENGYIHKIDDETGDVEETAQETFEENITNVLPEEKQIEINIIKLDENGTVMDDIIAAEPDEDGNDVYNVSFELYKRHEDGSYDDVSDYTMTYNTEEQRFESGIIEDDYTTDLFGIWKVVETSKKDGYLRAEPFEINLDAIYAGGNSEGADFTYDAATHTYTRTVTNYPNNVRIYKEDENGNKLAGAVFKLVPDRIEDEATKDLPQEEKKYITLPTITTEETNADGYVDISKIPDATYTISEVKAPDGYYIDDTTQYRIKVEDGKLTNLLTNTEGQSLAFRYVNNRNKITIKKKGMDGRPIAGAKFLLERVENRNDITASYEEIRKEYTGEIQQLDFNMEHEIPFVKEVTWSTVLTSDANGNVVIEEGDTDIRSLQNGFYILTETSAPSPYTPNTEPYTFIMTDKGTTVVDGETPQKDRTIEIKNGELPVSVEIIKTDDKNRNRLQGAEFTVYPFSTTSQKYDMENPVMVIGANNWNTTSQSYKATLTCTGSNEGKFLIKETKAPDNYEIDTNWVGYVNGLENNTFTFTVVNTPTAESPKAWLHKVDAKTGESMDGVEFLFWKEGDEENAVTLTTSPDNAPTGEYAEEGQPTNGWIYFSLGEGTELEPDTTYYYKETKTLQGYQLNSAVQSFKVNADYTIDGGHIMKVTMENHKHLTLYTGGTGRTLIYIGGLAMIILLIILVFIRKKKV